MTMIAAICRSSCCLWLPSHSKPNVNVLDIQLLHHLQFDFGNAWAPDKIMWTLIVSATCDPGISHRSNEYWGYSDGISAHLFCRTVKPRLLITLLCYPYVLLLQSLPSAKIEQGLITPGWLLLTTQPKQIMTADVNT
ncbi:hypothetical protein I315_00729 [Cryptococcus gattii Ru294]|nr:hypothetical protein I315_00729 [Cryptococcus gattii Ru294]